MRSPMAELSLFAIVLSGADASKVAENPKKLEQLEQLARNGRSGFALSQQSHCF
ncbi:MAG: hypothetical protein R3B96_12745 [Pirellulaceae bacterium]